MMSLTKEKSVSAFDEKTVERLERERKYTVKGLISLRKRRRALKLKQAKESQKISEDDRQNEIPTIQGPKEYERKTASYRLTKLSQLKRLRLKIQKEARERCLNEYKQRKFLASLNGLKTNLLQQKWDYYCHLNERKFEQERNKSKSLSRIKSKLKIDGSLPADTAVEKIMKYKREKRRQNIERKERMMKIVEKISKEMNDIFDRKRNTETQKRDLKKAISQSFRKVGKKEEEKVTVLEDSGEKDFEEFNSIKIEQDQKDEEEISENRELLFNDGIDIKQIIKRVISDNETSELPKDTCFCATPSVVTFDDFHVGRKYNRRIIITNKSRNWAYLRFRKIETEVWEPDIIEIEKIDAARVRPGLSVTINLKFSPTFEDKITGDICFLSLSPEDFKTYHEFRIPVCCNPESPFPVLEPKELRFPSNPIWKFNDSKFCERFLTISNEGGKSFSMILEKKGDEKDYFNWSFNDGEPQSVNSSMENIKKDEVEENNSTEKVGKKYQIEVPPKFKCSLKITFCPKYVGIHHEVLQICFLTDGKVFDKQNFPIWAEVLGPQIRVNPPCVDLGIVMMDSGVCQQIFDVINTGRTAVEVSIKTPKRLGNQVAIYPKSTLIQPETVSTISVRLVPESNIIEISEKYYDAVSSMLEFPIRVQIISQKEEKEPPLTLKVVANLTTCHALILEPPTVDLGVVYTNESVVTELKLTNDSLLIQEYGFINLPPYMEVQPNYGFGSILPGETISLDLIYSACLTDIPGNEIGANGLSGEQRFRIQVVTLAELAGRKKQLNIGEIKTPYFGQRGIPRPFNVVSNNIGKKNVTTELNNGIDKNDSLTEDAHEQNESTTKNEEELPNIQSRNIRTGSRKRKHIERNVIEVFVRIVDNFCEFSEQILEFPATPCGSFSMVSVHLRGFNLASYPHCTCGTIKNQVKEFTARYSFKCSSDRLKVAPGNGLLHSNELLKVTFIFEPELPKFTVLKNALESKAEIPTAQAKIKEEYPSKEDKSISMRKEKLRKKHSKAEEVTPKEISEELPAEVSLLEYFEPYISTIFVKCEIDINFEDKSRQKESLFAKLICPVIKPEIAILNADQEIYFGSTPIGTVSKKHLLVKNISNRNVKVNVSLLDPFGPFFVAPGKVIETGCILKLPVTYRPMKDHDEEIFEVSSSNSRTIWRVKLLGSAITPSWKIAPHFRVARLETTLGNSIELKISIENTCTTPLTFNLRQIDTLEGNISLAEEELREINRKKDKKEKTDELENKGKLLREEKFSDTLREDEELAIFGGKLETSNDRGYFSFRNFDDNMRLVVPENKKMEFGIRFHPPDNSEDKETAAKSGGKAAGKLKNTVSNKYTSTYRFVGLFKLMLDNSIFVQDIITICSIK